MTIKFIGTGSGLTSKERFHSSIFIETNNSNLLIDTGDGISKALLFQNINFSYIQNILITHFHPDHLSGIASLIIQMKLLNRIKPLNVFIQNQLLNSIKAFLKVHYIFSENLNFRLNLNGCNFNEEISLERNFSFLLRKNNHITDEKKSNQNYENIGYVSASVLIKCENKVIIYTSDIGNVEDLLLFNDFKCDFFISEATHLSPEEIYAAYLKSDSDKLILTHIENEQKISLWFENLTEDEKRNVIIAKDGFVLDLVNGS
ncbi:MAG: MBL fold metallo-hydrolase [Ignavibacteriales bacterium]|nr:MBL fold metallo-hydrolase [Ignavibacteriales bacterium]